MKVKMKKINLILAILAIGIVLCVFAVGQVPTEPPTSPTPPEPPLEYYQQEPSTPYLYPNAQINPWLQGQWQDAYCNQTGMDFLVEIMPDACSPAVVRSDLLEEQDVPVLCRMTGIKINPIIQVPYIKRIIPAVENKSDEIGYVTFLPARYALSYHASEAQKRPGFEGTPTMSNLGYLWIHLKRQPVEEKMPETVNADMSVRIIYDVARTYGINENQFVLPLLSQEEWFKNYKNYGFWRGKGYLKLQEITGKNSAKIALYTNPNMQPFAVKELRVGETLSKRDEIMLPGFYCSAGVTLRLDEISVPKTRTRLLVNGDEILLGEGEKIQESGCVVQEIESSPYSYSGTASIRCPGQAKQTLILRDIEATLKIEKEEKYEEQEVGVGSEIIVEKDKKTNHFYVGFLGKEYTRAGLDSIIILFDTKNNGVLSKNAVEKTSDSIHSYVKSQRGVAFEKLSDSMWNDELRKELKKKYPVVEKQIDKFHILKKGLMQKVDDIEMTVVDMTGPEQVNYPDDIEAMYKDAIQHYRDISHAYSTKQHPEGMYYGVIALRNAADLAAHLHKKIDQVELLKELIDKYSDYDEPEIITEVEDAREELRRTVNLGGENSATFSRPNGNYFIQLVAVEKPSLAMQSADIEVNGIRGTYGIGDTIDVWQISDITETDVVFNNLVKTGQTETIAISSLKYLDQTRVKLFDTVIKKEVKVTVLPFERERETITNFSVRIGIEKRAIQLSPEKTRELISSLDKRIEQFENIRDKLGNVVSAWKKACHVGAYALWIKNFVTGLGGEAAARKRVMEKWTTVCADPAYRKNIGAVSVSDCYKKKESAINEDIDLMKDSLNEANSFVKSVKASEGVTKSGGLFGLARTVDDQKFMEIADKTFPDELENIGMIHQQKQLKKITLADGAILYAGRRYENINVLITNVGGPQAFESIKDEYGEIENKFVETQKIIGNIAYLHQKNQLYKDDIKELYLILKLYKECKGKSDDSALCHEVIKGTYGSLSGYKDVLEEGTSQEALKDVLGIDAVVVVPEKRNAIKAPVYTMKNFPKLRTSLEEDENARFSYFYHAGAYYIAIVEATGDNNFGIITLYSVEKVGEDDVRKKETWTSETEETLAEKLRKLGISHIEEVDFTSCNNNEIKTPYRNKIKFWESGPYKDYVALMPIDRRAGWYMATTYTGLEGALVAWKENADINVFWICNVGQDGVPNFDHSKGPVGDDCCTQVALVTGVQPEIPPLSEAGSKQVVEQAKTCARNAIAEYTQGKRKIDTKKCGVFSLGKPPAARPAMQCEDFMSPTDCRIMFNLCDPVMCPPSRCDLGGRMPVDNVIASGVVGSLMLCLPNFEDGRGVLVPICLTGVHAGIDNFITILEAGRECLQEQLESGKTVGICDEIMSVYKCEFFWRQFEPFVQAGIPAITESLTRRGGGEYALFGESWQQSLDAYRYFTDYYSETSKQAFKARSTAQIGTEICKRFTSITYPTQAKFWEEIGKPESPTQAMAWFDERELGGGSPESHYKVFFHIFAGRDQGVYYSVYLTGPSASGYYQPPIQYFVPAEQGGFGYIPAGEHVSFTPDFRAPSGYKKICIRLNEKEICGFGQATTNFAIEELQNYYLQQQAAKDVSTSKECVSGKPTIIPTATLNIQSAVENIVEPAIYRRGIIRVCSTLNPGQGTELEERWKRIGDCDSPNVGCWLDTKSVEGAVSDLGIQENIMTEAEEKDITYTIEKYGLDKPEESQSKLNSVEPKILDIRAKVEDFIAKVNEMDVATFIASKKNLKNEIETIDKEIQPVINEFREISKLCIRSEEKARANYGLAQILDLRTRLNAQLGVYEAEKTRESCPGIWLTDQECASKNGVIKEGTFVDQKEGKVCCILPEKIAKETTFVRSLFNQWPLDLTYNELSSCYGWRTLRGSTDFTDGIDISAPRGTAVLSVADGEVVRAISGCVRGNENCNGGFGNGIVIKYSNNLYVGYHHLSKVNVKLGDSVGKGDKIGEVGSTGKSTGDHLDIKVYTSEADVWKNNAGKHPLCFFSSTIRANIRARTEAIDDSKKYSDNFIYSEKSGGCNPSQAYCKTIVSIYAEECKGLGKDNCNRIRGSCWWDSTDATCMPCPLVCEGANKIFVQNWFGDKDILFKTKSDCEQNNCGLSCLWSTDGKCYGISDKLIEKKIAGLNTMTVSELNELKNLIESNQDRLSSSKVNSWLSQINSKLEEIGPSFSVQEVLIYSSVNNGPLTPKNRLVNYDDSVVLCAVIKDNQGNLYSKTAFGNVQKYTGDAKFKWYNIVPLYQPQYNEAKRSYELFAKKGGNDILQYEQRQISGDDWCIVQEGVGTYWYRVEAEIDDYVFSSLGEPAGSGDRIAYVNKYGGTVNFDKYEGYWHTLLKPDAVEHYAISKTVRRISRKSNYAEIICENLGYNSNEKRCQFISMLEAYKNVPFSYGCSYYGCDPDVEVSEEGCVLEHLTEDFITIDCLDLMIGALSKTTGKAYVYNDFDNFIANYGSIKLSIEKKELSFILNSNLLFRKDNQIEIGDIIFMWRGNGEGYYTHTFVVYDDDGLRKGVFDEYDSVIYTSATCEGDENTPYYNYDGKLCYSPMKKYMELIEKPGLPEIKFTLFKIDDLD